jgi:hypothetical protein
VPLPNVSTSEVDDFYAAPIDSAEPP